MIGLNSRSQQPLNIIHFPSQQEPMKYPLALLFSASLLLSACASDRYPPQRACFHRNEEIEKDIGYCQALRSGHTLHISGVAGEGSMDAAVRSVYERLGKILEANGLSFANVVKENVYATDLDAFIRNREIRKQFYGSALPAATWV